MAVPPGAINASHIPVTTFPGSDSEEADHDRLLDKQAGQSSFHEEYDQFSDTPSVVGGSSIVTDEDAEYNAVLGWREPQYRTYWYRWVMLASLSSIVLLNSVLWVTYVPVTPQAKAYYDTSDFAIDLFAVVFMVLVVLFIVPSAWVADVFGIRPLVVAAGLLNAVAGLARFFGTFSSDPAVAYGVAMFGQVVSGVAGALLLPAPPKFSAIWFPEDERTVATGIAALATVLGVAVGYGMTISLVSTDDMTGDDIPLMLMVQGIVVAVPCILAAFVYREIPPTPPSSSADVPKVGSIWGVFRNTLRVPGYVTILCTVGAGYGAVTAVFSVNGDIAAGAGFSSDQAGLFGIVLVVAGMVGAIIFGGLTDHFRRYREILIGCFCTAVFFMLLLALAFQFEWGFAAITTIFGLIGFFAMALLPVSMEAAVEVTYPAPEAVVTSFILLFGNLWAIIITVVAEGLKQPDGNMVYGVWFLFVVGLLSCLGSFFFRGRYLRMEFEHAEQGGDPDRA